MPRTYRILRQPSKLRNAIAGIAFLALVGAFPAYGEKIHYTITFTATSENEPSASGSFDYDSGNKTFSNFLVEWHNELYDLTTSANDATGSSSCTAGKTGGAATFLLMTHCPGAEMVVQQGSGGGDNGLCGVEIYDYSDCGLEGIVIGSEHSSRGPSVLAYYTYTTAAE